MKTRKNPDEFQKSVRSRGLRLTRERLALFSGIRSQRGHFTVDGLVSRLKRRGCKVSRDTVYRNLPLLIEIGLLRSSFRTSRDTVYEVAEGRRGHDHLVCRECGKVVEFENPAVEIAQARIARKMGFRLERHDHQLIGVCAQCSR